MLYPDRGIDVAEVDHRYGHPESRFVVGTLRGGSWAVDATSGRSAPPNTWGSGRTLPRLATRL